MEFVQRTIGYRNDRRRAALLMALCDTPAMVAMTEAERRDAEQACRTTAEQALKDGDWHEAYLWTKSWISRGGAGRVEPWLLYVASALQQGWPKTAVHSCDLGLSTWIDDGPSRAVLNFVRGEVIRRHLNDPKTAAADLEVAATACPVWLASDLEHARTACTAGVVKSRKRKPTVGPAPTFNSKTDRSFTSETLPASYDITAEPPPTWPTVRSILQSQDPRTGARRGPRPR